MAESKRVVKDLPKSLREELKGSKYAPRIHPDASIPKPFDDSVERALFNEVLGPMLGSRPSSGASRPSSSSSSSSSSSVNKESVNVAASKPSSRGSVLLQPLPTDFPSTEDSRGRSANGGDFTTSILRRLNQAEEAEKLLRRQLSEVIMKNNKLQAENENLRSAKESDTGWIEEMSQLRSDNEQLQEQVIEMEQFLRDYGLEWVGYSGDGDNDETKEQSSLIAEKEEAHVNSYHHFLTKVDELNTLIKSEPVQIKTDDVTKRGKFVYAAEVSENFTIGFYKNGLMVRRGPFRAVGTPGYIHFCRDIMDGYFPSEFRNDYPDGVLFTVLDRRSESYTLEGDTAAVMTASELTSKLKDRVVRNGQIHDVKSEISALLGNNSGGVVRSSSSKTVPIHIETPEYLASRGEAKSSEECGGGMTACVQIKWIDGRILIAMMLEQDSISDLKREIITHINNDDQSNEGICPVFDLRSAYPSRKLGDELSLQEAGLTPNGTVHARKI